MSVVALFKVQTVELIPYGGWPDQPKVIARRVSMSPVKSEPFGSATPTGSLSMTITNPAAADQFELEGVYEVTFERVEGGLPVRVEG